MSVPQGTTVFQWIRVQAYNLAQIGDKMRDLFNDWSLFNASQKSTFRDRAVAQLDAVIAELQSIRTDLTNL